MIGEKISVNDRIMKHTSKRNHWKQVYGMKYSVNLIGFLGGFIGGFLGGVAGSHSWWINSLVGGFGAVIAIILINSFWTEKKH